MKRRSTRHRLSVLALSVVATAALPVSASASSYDQIVPGKVSIQYSWDESGTVIEFQGKVGGGGLCAHHRTVTLRAFKDNRRPVSYWLMTNRGSTWSAEAIELGAYQARIEPEVRFKRVRGERRSVLCKGDTSRRVTVSPPNAA